MLKKIFGGLFGSEAQGNFFFSPVGDNTTPTIFTQRQLVLGYHRYKWLNAVVNKTAEIGAAVPWLVTVDGEEIEDHPFANAMNNGNEVFPGLQNWLLAWKYFCILDEFHFLKERNFRGDTISFWPIPTHEILKRPILGKGTWQVRIGATMFSFEPEDIIAVVNPDPANPYGPGKGRGAALADDLETDSYATRYIKNFFRNSARPDLLISAADSESGFGKDQAERLEKKWLQKLHGVARASVPFFVTGGKIDVKEFAKDFRKMAMKDIRGMSRDAVLQVYGFPPEALGILENSNRATIEAAEFFLSKHVVLPKLIVMRAVFERELHEQDPRAKLGFISPVKEDMKTKIELMKSRPEAFRLNEVRKAAGEEVLEGLNVFPVPFNLNITGNPATPGLEELAGLRAPQLFFRESKNGPVLIDGTFKEITKAPDDIDDILAAIDANSPGPATVGIVSDTVAAFGDDLFRSLNLDIVFDLNDPAVVRFLRDYSSTRVVGVNGTIKEGLRRTLAEGLAAGDSLPALSTRVTQVFDASISRAGTIARTETVRASSFGVQEGMVKAGVKKKMWLITVGGSPVRDTHVALSGVTIPVENNFVSAGGASAPGPGQFGVPGEDINCQCGVVPVVPANLARLDTEEKRAEVWRVFENRRQQFERQLRRAFRRSFRAMHADVLAIVQG